MSFVPAEHPPTDWRTTGLIVCLASLCVVAMFWETVRSMIDVWASSRTFMHGFLVLPATGYLVWSHRHLWMQLAPVPSAWGVAALIPLEIVWLIGYGTDLMWLQQAAFIAILPGMVWAILGKDIVKILAWPLGFLAFMLPVGTSLEPWLQDLTVWFIQAGLHVANIPYVHEDYQLVMTSGIWEVAADCAGLRYLLPGLALGYAFSTLMYRQPSRRFIFLVVCAMVLIVANGIRAFGVILGDHYGIAEGADHRLFSYTIYGVTMPLLFWLGLRWAETASANSFPQRMIDPCHSFDTSKPIRMAIAAVTILAAATLAAWLWFNHS